MILEVKNLNFSYGKQKVLNNITFECKKGSMCILMGPNGSGKTTLLDCILGKNKTENSIFLNDIDISKLKRLEIAKQISYIPQIHNISFPYTLFDFVLMGRMSYAGLFGSPTKEDENICRDVIKKLDLEKYENLPYSSLSGGEIRLALLARTLCQGSKLILLDEPTAYLDFRNEMIFLEEISKLIEKEDITVIMASHSPNHAFYFEEKGIDVNCLLLNKGSCFAKGEPSKVLNEDAMEKIFGVEALLYSCNEFKSMYIKKAIK